MCLCVSFLILPSISDLQFIIRREYNNNNVNTNINNISNNKYSNNMYSNTKVYATICSAYYIGLNHRAI